MDMTFIERMRSMNQEITKIRRKLMTELDRERYEHTLGVMYTAASMAMCHGTDTEQALLAGLLHDCAKCIPNSEKIQICREERLAVSEVEKANPSLLHAKLGAFFARKQYGVSDTEVLDAIKSHTTGRPGMSLLEKIVYIADYIEPGRKELPNMKDVRQMAFEDIDKCLYKILEDSLVYLNSRGIPIDPMTEQTYLYYKEEQKKEE